MTDVFAEIVRLRERGEDCALCTIVATRGSTPGKEAMKMLVRADGSFVGSVGGGCLEAEVLEAALESLADDRPRRLEFSLNERDYPDSGLICGGRLEIYVEPITEPRLTLFGGGHVSAAIARAARPVGFHVTVVDDRPEFADPDTHPDAHETVSGDLAERARALGNCERGFVAICTRGHSGDGTVLEGLFRGGARPRWIGMIGSRAKRAQLFDELEGRGVDRAWLERVESPMGLPIGARTHEEIAVSVVARLVAARRGVETGRPAPADAPEGAPDGAPAG